MKAFIIVVALILGFLARISKRELKVEVQKEAYTQYVNNRISKRELKVYIHHGQLVRVREGGISKRELKVKVYRHDKGVEHIGISKRELKD